MLEGQGTAGASDSGSTAADVSTSAAGGSGSTGETGLTGSGGGGSASLASGDGGSAPAVAGDAAAGVTGAPADAAAAQAQAEFLFAGRKWTSQKAAEDAYRASFGRNWEGKLKERDEALSQRDAEIQALRKALTGGNGQGQGAARGSEPTPAADPNAPLAKQLAESRDLDFLVSLLETKEGEDPTLGVKRFTLGLADTIDKMVNSRVQAVQEQHIQPILRQRQFEQGMQSTMGVVRSLTGDFPELDEANSSPEAVEHQQAFVENLKQFPPEMVTQNPQLYLLATALLTRYQHGTPVFAQTPGTSGSPSARAVAASAQALGLATPNPLDGTGTPRPRPGGVETAEDRIRRENAAAPGNFHTPSGRDLGFGPA